MANNVWEDIKVRVAASYGEAFEAMPESGRAVLNAYRGLPIFKKTLITGAVGGVLAATIGPALLMGSTSAVGLQVLGLGGLLLGQMAAQNKDHRHILAMVSASTAVITVQCLANGDIPGAAMVGHAALFTAMCASMPEEGYKKARHAVTWGMAAAGAGLAAVFSGAAAGKILQGAPELLQQTINAIPTATVLINAYAFSRPDSETQRARLCYVFCNIAHLAYFATRDNPSAGILLAEATYLANNPVALYRFDLVKTDKNGDSLPLSRRLGIYFKNTIWNGEDRSAHGLTPDDLSKRAVTVVTPTAPHIS